MANGRRGTPDTASMETPSTLTNDDAALIKQVTALVVQQMKGGLHNNNKPKDGKHRAPWRQYKFYCQSRGVNTHCDGTQCRPTCSRRDDHDATATFADRRGGSERLAERWMGWCGPDNKFYKKQSDYKATE